MVLNQGNSKNKSGEEPTFNIIKDIIRELNDSSIDYREIVIKDRVKEFAEKIKCLKSERLEWAILRFIDKLNDPSDKIREHIAETLQQIVDEISNMGQKKFEFAVRRLLGRLEERNDRVYEHLATVVSSLAAKRPEVFKDKVDILFLKLSRPCKDPYNLDDLPHDEFAGFPNRCQHARTAIAEAILEVSKKYPELFDNRISDLAKLLHDSNDEVILIALEIIENIGSRKPETIKNITRDLVTCLRHDPIRYKAASILWNHAENNVDILKEEIDLLFEALMDSLTDWDTAELLIDIIHVVWKKYPKQVEEKIEKIWDKLNEYTIETIEWLALKSSKMVLKLTPKLKENLYNKTYNEIYQELSTSAALTLLYIGIDYPQLIEDTLPKITEYLTHPYEEVYENLSDNLTILIKKHPQTINKILPKLLQILPKLLTNKKYSKHHITKIANLLKTITTTKPETLNKITPLLNKLNKTDNETRKIKLILEKINNTQKQK